ncbi:hypothetical protein F0U83_11580 [Neptunomonas concharum]|uniref:CUB domain-containing protein n=1 Tax=Neptunomonas concharum TaxID=1031538 RepID=A0A5P1RDF3_9GAMM|nr:DUF6701 domain-containing protein [Neptunomonas concharum]QEQ97301.1 hypothetical protein F0U83_11580 [Neptunomonas concharum]
MVRLVQFCLYWVLFCIVSQAHAENICSTSGSSANTGYLYDSGGTTANYNNNESCGFLIQPGGAGTVTLTISAASIETGYDYLYLYDGTSAAAPLIAQITGTTTGTYSASSGAMYIRFVSDYIITAPGFRSSWAFTPSGPVVIPAPRADWHLDELSWTGTPDEIKDYSGNSFHGQAGTTLNTDAAGVVCRAIDFTPDTLTDFISLDSAAFHGQDEMSFSVWGKTSERNTQALLSAFGPDHGNELLLWFDRSNYFQPLVKNDSFSIGANGFAVTDFADNQWHHFVYTRRADKNCLYIDGALQGCRYGVAQGPLNLSPGSVVMGQEQDALGGGFDLSQDWDGWIDEPMLFSSELNTQQIAEIYNNQRAGNNYDGTPRHCILPAPVVNYHMDDCNWSDNQDVVDSGPNSLDAYSVNGVISTVGGQVCGLAQFDGVDDFIRLPDNGLLDLSTSLTVTAWVKLDAIPTELKSFISKDTNYEIHINQNRQIYWWWNDSNGVTRNLTSSAQVSVGQWHHVVVTYQPDQQIIYLDGVEVARQSYPDGLVINNRELQIGQDQGVAARFFNGDIDEVKVFDVALTPFEVEDIFANEQAGRNYDGSVRPCNCTPPPSVDHYSVSHSGSLVSCLTEHVTFTAHDSGDLAVDAEDALLQISTSTSKGRWLSVIAGSGVLTDLGNGQATYQFPDNGETSVTLAFSYPSLATDPELVNFDVSDGTATDKRDSNHAEDLNLSVSDSGLVFDVPDTESCQSSVTVNVSAVRTQPETLSCGSAVAGSRTVNFYSQYLQPSSGTEPVQITSSGNSYIVAGTAPGTPVTMNFNAQGVASMTVRYADAGRMGLYASLTAGQKILTGSDDFVVYPAQLTAQATTPSGALLHNGSSVGGITWAAANPFNLKVSAQCADGRLTSNYQPSQAEIGAQLLLPTLAVGGSSGSLNLAASSLTVADSASWLNVSTDFSGGELLDTAVTYSEVGSLQLFTRDTNYFGHLIAVMSTPLGRFIPSHFGLAANSPQWQSHCGMNQFNYLDKRIAYQDDPELTVTAFNASGVRVNNYGAALWKLSPQWSSRAYIDRSTAAATFSDVINATGGSWGSSDQNYDGIGLNRLSGDEIIYQRVALEAPFSGITDLLVPSPDLTDSDGACYRVDSDGDGDWLEESCSDYTVSSIPVWELRFGRLHLSDAYGPETQILPVPWSVEYYDGNDFVTNTLDSCTSWLNSEVSFIDQMGSLMADGSTSPSFAYPASDFRVDVGDAGLQMSAPGEGKNGTIGLGVDLSRLPYLRYDWNGLGGFDDDPSADIYFGKYRSHDKVIFQRHQ